MYSKLKFSALLITLCIPVWLSGQVIFKVNTPEEANIKVFVTSEESQADMNVLEVDKAEKVNKDGVWFYSSTPEEAQLKIFLTVNAEQADMKVFFVNEEAAAGWVNKEKRHLFKVE